MPEPVSFERDEGTVTSTSLETLLSTIAVKSELQIKLESLLELDRMFIGVEMPLPGKKDSFDMAEATEETNFEVLFMNTELAINDDLEVKEALETLGGPMGLECRGLSKMEAFRSGRTRSKMFRFFFDSGDGVDFLWGTNTSVMMHSSLLFLDTDVPEWL